MVGIELLANRGDEAATRAKAEAGLSLAGPIGLDAAIALIHAALLRLEVGFGRYSDACSHAKLVFDHDDFTFGNTTLSDTVEAATRAG